MSMKQKTKGKVPTTSLTRMEEQATSISKLPTKIWDIIALVIILFCNFEAVVVVIKLYCKTNTVATLLCRNCKLVV